MPTLPALLALVLVGAAPALGRATQAEAPAAERPATEQPATEQPADGEPADGEPAAEIPTPEPPDEPAPSKPTPAWPALDEPAAGPERQAVLSEELAGRRDLTAPASSPAVFFRGTHHLFYRDLAARGLPAASRFAGEQAVTWIHGDLHPGRFGARTDDRGHVVYELGGFGEAWTASYLLDLWRLSTAVVLEAAAAGVAEAALGPLVEELAGAYLDALESFRGNLDERHLQLTQRDVPEPVSTLLKQTEKAARQGTFWERWTEVADGSRRLKGLVAPGAETRSALVEAVAAYKNRLASRHRGKAAYFEVLDVGSAPVETAGGDGDPPAESPVAPSSDRGERYWVLIAGNGPGPEDDRVLELERHRRPAYLPFLPETETRRLLERFEDEEGCRVAYAERAMVARADDHLGCAAALGGSFSVRERAAGEAALDPALLAGDKTWRRLSRAWGRLLAAAHARADADFDDGLVPHELEESVLELVGEEGAAFRREVAELALGYARQAAADHASLRSCGEPTATGPAAPVRR